MHLAVKVNEYLSWQDQRLAYANKTNVSSYFMGSRMDISPFKRNLWTPKISYTEQNEIDLLQESIYLYPNGTITFFRELVLTITCEFNYANIPSDVHHCETVAYIQNEFNDTAYLIFVNKFTETRNQTYLTWQIQLSSEGNMDVRWKTDPTGVCSGVKMVFDFQREPSFLYKIFVTPSIIFVVLAYMTFWIDHKKAPARVIFCITNILNSISLLSATNNYIPEVPI